MSSSSNPVRLSRLLGLLVLLLVLCGPPSIVMIPGKLDEILGGSSKPDLPALSMALRLGLLGDSLIILLEAAGVIPVLFALLQPIAGTTMAAACLLPRLAQLFVMAANLSVYAGMLSLAGMAAANDYMLEGAIGTLRSLKETHAYGVKLWEIPFALHLALLGATIIGCNGAALVPKPCVFAALLCTAAAGYVLDAVAGIFYGPSNTTDQIPALCSTVGATMSTLGELPFFVYLGVWGPAEGGVLHQHAQLPRGAHHVLQPQDDAQAEDRG